MNYSKKPEMIFFDVGGTLFDDGKCIPASGFEALRLSAVNPDVTTAEKLESEWYDFFGKTGSLRSTSNVTLEVPLSAVIKYATLKTGLIFDISIHKQEEIFDRFNSARSVIDGVTELLGKLSSSEIRSAVISNNAMSGESLTLSIDRYIPTNNFEFCLTSADILFTKPSAEIFITAANLAGVEPTGCWYCGDSIAADIIGSANIGMTPVLLDRNSSLPIEMRNDDRIGTYMAVNNWSALTEYISEL